VSSAHCGRKSHDQSICNFTTHYSLLTYAAQLWTGATPQFRKTHVVSGFEYEGPTASTPATALTMWHSVTDDFVRIGGCCDDGVHPRCCCGIARAAGCRSAPAVFQLWLHHNKCARRDDNDGGGGGGVMRRGGVGVDDKNGGGGGVTSVVTVAGFSIDMGAFLINARAPRDTPKERRVHCFRGVSCAADTELCVFEIGGHMPPSKAPTAYETAVNDIVADFDAVVTTATAATTTATAAATAAATATEVTGVTTFDATLLPPTLPANGGVSLSLVAIVLFFVSLLGLSLRHYQQRAEASRGAYSVVSVQAR
jgi:hypothetical protein